MLLQIEKINFFFRKFMFITLNKINPKAKSQMTFKMLEANTTGLEVAA